MSTNTLDVLQRDMAQYQYGVRELSLALDELYADQFMSVDEMHLDDDEICRQLGHGLIEHDPTPF